MAQFTNWWNQAHRWEGSYAQWAAQAANQYDQGGATAWGIQWNYYPTWAPPVGLNPSWNAFTQLTPGDAGRIGKRYFWDAVGADKIANQGVANMVVDWAWGSGPGTAGTYIQKALNSRFNAGLAVDGDIGPNTIAALNRYEPYRVLSAITDARKQFLTDLANRRPTDEVFLKGWLNRVNSIYTIARSYVPDAVATGGTVLLIAAVGLGTWYLLSDNKK